MIANEPLPGISKLSLGFIDSEILSRMIWSLMVSALSIALLYSQSVGSLLTKRLNAILFLRFFLNCSLKERSTLIS